MSPELHAWAAMWGVHPAALDALAGLWGMHRHALHKPGEPSDAPRSEAYTQSVCRLAAARRGYLVFRNNIGAMQDETGRWVRYGLANDSAKVNREIKSGDLIGGKPVVIRPGMVGTTLLQFWSREMKHEGWKYTGTGREPAQLRWIELVNGAGGDAGFSTGEP